MSNAFRFNLRRKLTLSYLAIGLHLTLINALSAYWLDERWST